MRLFAALIVVVKVTLILNTKREGNPSIWTGPFHKNVVQGLLALNYSTSRTLPRKILQSKSRHRNVHPLIQKRTGLDGTFRFLAKGQKLKAIANETPQQKEERERKNIESTAMEEFRKAITRGYVGQADRYLRTILSEGGSVLSVILEIIQLVLCRCREPGMQFFESVFGVEFPPPE